MLNGICKNDYFHIAEYYGIPRITQVSTVSTTEADVIPITTWESQVESGVFLRNCIIFTENRMSFATILLKLKERYFEYFNGFYCNICSIFRK